MVNENDNLGQLLKALSDPTRREIYERLSRSVRPLTVQELAAPHSMSLPAISKHLKYLERSGLITRAKVGRTYLLQAERTAVDEINWWLAEQLHFWNQSLDGQKSERSPGS